MQFSCWQAVQQLQAQSAIVSTSPEGGEPRALQHLLASPVSTSPGGGKHHNSIEHFNSSWEAQPLQVSKKKFWKVFAIKTIRIYPHVSPDTMTPVKKTLTNNLTSDPLLGRTRIGVIGICHHHLGQDAAVFFCPRYDKDDRICNCTVYTVIKVSVLINFTQ